MRTEARNVYLWAIFSRYNVSYPENSPSAVLFYILLCLQGGFRNYKLNISFNSYGESHCRSVGCIVDGCPPGLPLTEATDIQPQMTRRRPGQSAITTPRDEKDRVEIQSGTEFGITLGTPIGIRVLNEDQRPRDYGNKTMDRYPRPSHADWTYLEKYGVKASSGGGRSSARETIGMRRKRMKRVRICYLMMQRQGRCRCYSRKISPTSLRR